MRPTLIRLDDAVQALACHFAVAGPPGRAEFEKASKILSNCFPWEDDEE